MEKQSPVTTDGLIGVHEYFNPLKDRGVSWLLFAMQV